MGRSGPGGHPFLKSQLHAKSRPSVILYLGRERHKSGTPLRPDGFLPSGDDPPRIATSLGAPSPRRAERRGGSWRYSRHPMTLALRERPVCVSDRFISGQEPAWAEAGAGYWGAIETVADAVIHGAVVDQQNLAVALIRRNREYVS